MPVYWRYVLFLLTLVAVTVWLAVIFYPSGKFRIIACDVGQGDAILATYRKTQVLVDGGPSRRVIDCLSRHIPFWDRNLEVVLLTHPQKDHYMGLIEVFERYDVQLFITTGLDSSAQEYEVLKSLVTGKGVRVVNPESGMKIGYDLIYLDILHPSKEFLAKNLTSQVAELTPPRWNEQDNVLGAFTSKKDPNDFSIVSILSFGEFDALLTGDIGPDVTGDILKKGLIKDVDYLKVPHHGSKNGLTQDLLEKVSPQVAVISSGKNNSYGHPHKEVLKMLEEMEVKVLRTDGKGDVKITTDGEKWW